MTHHKYSILDFSITQVASLKNPFVKSKLRYQLALLAFNIFIDKTYVPSADTILPQSDHLTQVLQRVIWR